MRTVHGAGTFCPILIGRFTRVDNSVQFRMLDPLTLSKAIPEIFLE
jgi:hypothetical protein